MALSDERKKQLDEIGFEWAIKPKQVTWEENVAALEKYKVREGHCRVPRNHIEGEYKLGQWVNRQRSNRNILSADHKRRLDAIGFLWRVNKS